MPTATSLHWYVTDKLPAVAHVLTAILDNAVMIAWAAMHRYVHKDMDPYFIMPRSQWPLDSYTAQTALRHQIVSCFTFTRHPGCLC